MYKLLLFIQEMNSETANVVKLLHQYKAKFEILRYDEHIREATRYKILILPTLVKSYIQNGDEMFLNLNSLTIDSLKQFLNLSG